MKKRISAFILAIMMLLSFASCAEKKDTPDEKDGQSEENGSGEFKGPLFIEELAYDYDLSEYITLPDHSALELTYNFVETTDEAVDTVIEEQLIADGEQEATSDPAQKGDMVVYNCVGKLMENGSVIEQASGRTVVIGGAAYVEGFTENFIGLKTGDAHTFEYIYPMDYYVAELAGIPVVYSVTVTSVKKVTPAQLTDEYVASLEIEGVTDVNEYREYIRELHSERAEVENSQNLRDKVYSILSAGAVVHKYPEKEYNYYYNICEKTNNTYATVNGISVEAYVNQNYGSREAYEEYAKSYCEEHVLEDMIMWTLAREYSIEVDREEYLDEMEYGYANNAESYGVEDKAEFEDVFGYDVSEGILLKDALNAVVENAVINGK
ncbi:MAG: hypothetical protein IJC50_09815 [Clostridia bacterium]|nr:hypothetical protein [Clostridia bacterium]